MMAGTSMAVETDCSEASAKPASGGVGETAPLTVYVVPSYGSSKAFCTSDHWMSKMPEPPGLFNLEGVMGEWAPPRRRRGIKALDTSRIANPEKPTVGSSTTVSFVGSVLSYMLLVDNAMLNRS